MKKLAAIALVLLAGAIGALAPLLLSSCVTEKEFSFGSEDDRETDEESSTSDPETTETETETETESETGTGTSTTTTTTTSPDAPSKPSVPCHFLVEIVGIGEVTLRDLKVTGELPVPDGVSVQFETGPWIHADLVSKPLGGKSWTATDFTKAPIETTFDVDGAWTIVLEYLADPDCKKVVWAPELALVYSPTKKVK